MTIKLSDLPEEMQAQVRAQSNIPRGVGRNKFGVSFRSDLERDAWHHWVPAKNPAAIFYEALTFHLPSGGYKPDFVMIMPDGEIWVIEVKGWNKNLRADRRKFLEGAVTHPWAHWCWLTREHGQWIEDWK